MAEQDRNEIIIAVLKGDSYLCTVAGEADPQVILMPFATEGHKHYVMIGLFVSEAALKKEVICAICLRVLDVLNDRQLLDGLDGVEIVPCSLKNGKTTRVLRLSILSDALQRATRLVPEDLLRQNPAEGITCILYARGI